MGALPGSATYLDAAKTRTCNRCGTGNLAWAKSARTGRPYLCSTQPSSSDYRDAVVVMPWAPHRCDETPAATVETVAARGTITRDQQVRAMVALADRLRTGTSSTRRRWQAAALDRIARAATID